MSKCEGQDVEAGGLLSIARRLFLRRATLASAAAATGFSPGSGAALSTSSKASILPCANVPAPLANVSGKVAFITGGSSGIGLGIARAFLDAGMKVVITYRTKSHMEDATSFLEDAGERLHAIEVDVTDRPGMERAAAETLKVFGKVHVLVNNAGVNDPKPLTDFTYDVWDWIININLNGVFNGVRTFLPLIQKQNEGGQIVTISSIYGLFAADSGGSAYSAAKYGVVGMMESLRSELRDTNIGVSIVCPGAVPSNISVSRNRGSTTGRMGESEMTKALAKSPVFMDPMELGRRVLDGVRRNELYVLTHPEYERLIRERSETLAASLLVDPRSVDDRLTKARAAVAAASVRSSIYALERDRKRCQDPQT